MSYCIFTTQTLSWVTTLHKPTHPQSEKAAMDYCFHMAVTSWSDDVAKAMARLTAEEGINSYKFFMAYKVRPFCPPLPRIGHTHRQTYYGCMLSPSSSFAMNVCFVRT